MTTTVIYGNLGKGLFVHILIITRANTSKNAQHNYATHMLHIPICGAKLSQPSTTTH